MTAKLINRNYTYSLQLKKEAVQLYLDGYSAVYINDKFQIQDKKRIFRWVKKVEQGGFNALKDNRGKNSPIRSKPKLLQTLESV